MSDTTTIEWTRNDDGTPGRTWNPVTGCTKVSPGCDNCYAETIAERFRGAAAFPHGFDVQVRANKVNDPLKWRKPTRVFVNSMSDLFHAEIPRPWLADIFAVMAATRRHTFQVLTKRHGPMRSLMRDDAFVAAVRERAAGKGLPVGDFQWPLPNLWLGVSVEDQVRAELRIPALMDTPAAVRFLSCEPLLGPLDLTRWLRPIPGCAHADPDDGTCGHPEAFTPECWRGADCPLVHVGGEWHGPDWVIVGGESGRGARPMDIAWAEEIVHECRIADVPVFVKQLGIRAGGKAHHDIDTFPEALRVREFPGAVSVS